MISFNVPRVPLTSGHIPSHFVRHISSSHRVFSSGRTSCPFTSLLSSRVVPLVSLSLRRRGNIYLCASSMLKMAKALISNIHRIAASKKKRERLLMKSRRESWQEEGTRGLHEGRDMFTRDLCGLLTFRARSAAHLPLPARSHGGHVAAHTAGRRGRRRFRFH